MSDYLRNTTTNELIRNSNLGKYFVTPLWVDATQPEIDAWLLSIAKVDKHAESKLARNDFQNLGFTYLTKVYCLKHSLVVNLCVKNMMSDSNPNRYKFCDINGDEQDHTDAAGWALFNEAINGEKDRIMLSKFNGYKTQIDACGTVSAVDAIIIDYSA